MTRLALASWVIFATISPMIRLKFPIHAQARIEERGIEIDHIKKAIREPDFTKHQFEGRILVGKKIDKKRTIEVVYCKESSLKKTNDYLVVTAYYL